MHHREVERFQGLAREGPSGSIGDGDREHDRSSPAVKIIQLFNRVNPRLQIEGVKSGLKHQQIGTGIHQRSGLFQVSLRDFIEFESPIGGVLHIRRKGAGAVGGSDGPCDPDLFPGMVLLKPACGLLCNINGSTVQLFDIIFKRVVLLGYTIGVEGIGSQDPGSGLKVIRMDLFDDFGTGDGEQVVVALQRIWVICKRLIPEILLFEFMLLNHGAHRSIQQHDFFIQFFQQAFRRISFHHCSSHDGSLFNKTDGSIPNSHRQNNLEKLSPALGKDFLFEAAKSGFLHHLQ